MSPAPGPSGSFSRGRAACLPGQLRALRSEHAPPRGGGGASLCTSGSPCSGSALSPQRTVCKPALSAKMTSGHPPLLPAFDLAGHLGWPGSQASAAVRGQRACVQWDLK